MRNVDNKTAARGSGQFLLPVVVGTLVVAAAVGGYVFMRGQEGAMAPTTGVCTAEAAEYTIRPLENFRFGVEVRLGAPATLIDIVSREDTTGSVTTDDFIENVRLLNADGSEHPLKYEGVGSWRLGGAAVDRPIVRYEIRAGHDAHGWAIGKEEIAYNFDGSSFFTGWTVLLTDYAQQACPSLITFDVPENWKVAAPWKHVEGKTYRADNTQDLQKNGFALGPSMPTFEVQAGDSSLTVVYENAVAGIARQATEDADAIFSYYQNVYGGPAGSSYVIFMVSDEGTDGGAFVSSFAQRFSLPSNTAEELVWRHGFAHEVGHLWNGITIVPANPNDNEWFKEGFTDYLTLKALTRIDAINEVQLEMKLANILRRYYLSLYTKGPMSLVEAGANKQENRMLVYGGGALFALLLDGQLSRIDGAGTFESMLTDVYRELPRPYTSDQLMQILDAASNGGASRLLSDVNEGISPQDMKARFSTQGLDLGVFAPEELYVVFSPDNCGPGGGQCAPDYLR